MQLSQWRAGLNAVMPIESIRQGPPILAHTHEWYTARRGRITASKRAETIAVGGAGAWANMRTEIDYELSPGYVREELGNKYTQWGNDNEAQAIANAELELGASTIEPGFLLHPEHDEAGATPDFFIDSDISGQIKCPYYAKNHLKFVYDKTLPSTYYHQVQFEAWISQRKKIIFMSYDPRQPLATRCAIIELDASMQLWDKFDSQLQVFRKFYEREQTPTQAKFLGFDGIPELF